MQINIEELKYPIGKFQAPVTIDNIQIKEWIETIERFPGKLSYEVLNLTQTQLEKQYRPNGWTIRQVVNIVQTVI